VRLQGGSALACLSIAAVIGLLYAQTLSYGYVGLDDEVMIQGDHEFLRDLGNLPRAFLRGVFASTASEAGNFYRPLLVVSLMIDTQLGGTDLTAFRVTNVLLHVVATCLVLHLLMALGARREIALLLAIVFAVHPLHVVAVAWIAGRNDPLLAVFALSCLLLLIRFQRTGSWPVFGLHVLFFALALFTKESGLALLLVQPLLIGLVSNGDLRSSRSRALGAAWIAVVVIWFSLRSVALASARETAIGPAAFVANLPDVLGYVGKIAFPFNLSMFPNLRDTGFVYGILAVGTAAIVLARSKRVAWRRVTFGGAWFAAFLLPSLAVPSLPPFEHRMYLPLIGVLIAAGGIDWIEHANPRSFRVASAALVVVAGFFSISFARCLSFRDFDSFWASALVSSPHSGMAHQKYASGLVMRGRLDEAVDILSAYLQRGGSARQIHYQLALAYAGQGRSAEAERHLIAELEIDPRYAPAKYLLGVMYQGSGRETLAVELWQQAIESDPRFTRAYRALLEHYSSRGDRERVREIEAEMRRVGITSDPARRSP
jgi:hypothetical protein